MKKCTNFEACLQNFVKRLLRASSRVSVRTEYVGSHWTNFHEIWYLKNFSNICQEDVEVVLISDNNSEYFYMQKCKHLWKYLAEFLLECEMFRQRCRENQSTQFLFNYFLSENRAAYEMI